MLRGTIIGIATVLFLTRPAAAQPVRPQFGIDVGASLATVTGDEITGAKTKVGPYYGLNAVFQRPGSVLGLQTGLYYVSRGAKVDDPDLPNVNASVKLGYVELPVMLRIAPVTKDGGAVPAFYIGSSLALRTGCRLVAGSVSVDCDDPDADVQLKSFDFGVTLGGEVAIPAGPRLFVVPSARFTQSITSISKQSGTDAKNRTIQLGVGLRRHR